MTKVQTTLVGLLFLAGVATPLLLNSRADARVNRAPQTIPQSDSSPVGLTPATPTASLSAAPKPDSALARLENWLHKVDQTNPSGTGIDDELRFLIWSLAASDYSPAWRLREGLRSVVVRNRFQYELLGFWSKLDPQAALTLALSVSKDTPGNNTVALVLANWGEKDPEAALAWARQFLPESRRPYRLAEALAGKARHDPLAALKLVEELPGIGARSVAFQNIIREWAERAPESAALYVNQLSPSRQRSSAFELLARGWAESDPEGAVAWARALLRPEECEAFVDAVVRNWQASDPEGALAWLRKSNPPEALKPAVYPKSK